MPQPRMCGPLAATLGNYLWGVVTDAAFFFRDGIGSVRVAGGTTNKLIDKSGSGSAMAATSHIWGGVPNSSIFFFPPPIGEIRESAPQSMHQGREASQ